MGNRPISYGFLFAALNFTKISFHKEGKDHISV